MPLKESDLKDADSYKKASRLDLSKLASGNAKFWIYKDVELPAPGGRKQKYPAFLALVDDNGIRKAMTGKKLLCKGTCGMKDERIAFEPSSGAVPYKVLKVSVPLLLGKPVLIPAGREEEEAEVEGEDGDGVGAAAGAAQGTTTPPPAPPPPAAAQHPPAAPALTAASLTGAWSKLTKDVQTYVAAHPEGKVELFRDMSAIGALLKANQAAEAKTKMDQMQAMLASPAPRPPAASEPAGAAGAARAAARWGGLQKQLQAAVAANPARRPELVKATAGLADLIRSGKFDAAAKQMDAIELELQENPKEKEYRARRQAMEGRLAEALKDPARDGSGLRAMNAFIVEKAEAGDFEAALKALQKLEEALSAKPKPSGEAVRPGGRDAANEAEESETEEEEEDPESKAETAEFQKDLKGRMVAALGQVRVRAPREGQEPKPQMQFMVYVAGNHTSVIVAKRVGGSMKKLLAEIAGATGGKILRGECIFEANAHTFVLENVPGGLAKKLTKALLAETAAKYKVRVRAADGSSVLDDETDVDPDEAGSPRESTGTGIPSNIVAKRKFLIERWQKIPPQVKANLKALKDAIAREMPDENAEELIGLSEQYLDEFCDEMKEAIDDDINSGDAQYKNAIATIQDFRQEIASEPLIQHLKSNPLGASIDVESILLGALSEVEKSLAS